MIERVSGRGSEEIQRLGEVGDSYTVEEAGRYSVKAYQNDRVILLETHQITE